MMDGSGKTVVIDTSMVVAWLMPDEKVVEEVDKLFNDMTVGEIDFVAPTLLKFEVWNSIKMGVLRKRISRQSAEKLLDKFDKIRIRYIDEVLGGKEVLELALSYGLSAYDATYVVLSKDLGCKLFSLDKKLMALVE